MEIRPYQHTDLKDVLALIRRSDSTNRTETTWEANEMTATLAFDDGKLIGAIPVEPRTFDLGQGETLDLLWVSAVHVDPEYRSKGVGASLDAELRRAFYPRYQGVFVYREDEASPAYRWYKKMGYYVLTQILAYKRSISPMCEIAGSQLHYLVLDNAQAISAAEKDIFDCYKHNNGEYGGGQVRHPRYWSHKLTTHYYREFYRYGFVVIEGAVGVESFAFVGETKIRDGIARLDLLEVSSPSKQESLIKLLKAVEALASQRGLQEIRVQISHEDPLRPHYETFGFTRRWQTFQMGALIRPHEYLQSKISKKKINQHLLSGFSMEQLNLLLLHRLDVEKESKELAQIFQKHIWKFQQIDYI